MTKLPAVALAAILMLALLACEKGSVDGPGGSVLGDVNVGESLHLEGDYKTIDVHVLEIVEDTRCAENAQCADPGAVSVRLQVDTVRPETGATTSKETTVEIIGGDTPAAQTVDGVWLRLYYVEPKQVAGQSIERGDYSVRMRITDVVFV